MGGRGKRQVEEGRQMMWRGMRLRYQERCLCMEGAGGCEIAEVAEEPKHVSFLVCG